MCRNFADSLQLIPLLLVFLFSITSASGQINWQLNPLLDGGRFDAIADLGDGVIVAGSRGDHPGIIFRSTDYGITWQNMGPIVRQEGVLERNGILCLMKGRDNYVYLITADAQFWRSEDNGISWKKTAQMGGGDGKWTYSYSICVTPRGTVLTASGSSIFRSTDDGLNFEKIGPISEKPIYRLNVTGDGVVVNGWAGTVYKSLDDGQTWQYWAKLDSTPLYAVDYLGRTVFLQASESGRMFKCDQHWPDRIKEITGLEGAADDFVYLGYKTVMYSTYKGEKNIYITRDEGETWENTGPIPTGVEGDWLDHIIRVVRQDSVIAIGGTNKGFIARAAFTARKLYEESEPERDQSIEDDTALERAVLGVVTDYKELNEPEDVLIDGDYAYVPCRVGHNLAVIDISDPRFPRVVESFRDEELAEAMGVEKHGKYIYLTSMGNEKCLVLDASDPLNLKKIYSFRVGGVNKHYNTLRKVVYADGYLYFSHDGEGALYIADASNPERPEIISRLMTETGAFAIKIDGDVAYVGGCVRSNSLKAIDISDKKNPRLISQLEAYPEYSCVCDFKITGNTLHAISYGANAYIQFDISDPTEIREKARLQSELLAGPNRFVLMDDKPYLINSVNNSVAELNIEGDLSVSKIISSGIFLKAYGLNYRDGLLYIVSRDGMNFVVLDPKEIGDFKGNK